MRSLEYGSRRSGRAFLSVAALSTILLGCSPSVSSADSFSVKYDRWFKSYASTYFTIPTEIWGYQLLKAQCYQESLLDPDAVSHAGAKGLCQFMPGTWREWEGRTGIAGSVYDPALSIMFASRYMGSLRLLWRAKRPEKDRVQLAQASYNAGAGNLLKAQKRCGGPNRFNDIMACLPQVTGIHSKETTTYVQRIWRWWSMMV